MGRLSVCSFSFVCHCVSLTCFECQVIERDPFFEHVSQREMGLLFVILFLIVRYLLIVSYMRMMPTVILTNFMNGWSLWRIVCNFASSCDSLINVVLPKTLMMNYWLSGVLMCCVQMSFCCHYCLLCVLFRCRSVVGTVCYGLLSTWSSAACVYLPSASRCWYSMENWFDHWELIFTSCCVVNKVNRPM